MKISTLTSAAAAFVGVGAVVGTLVIVNTGTPASDAGLWIDAPVAGATVVPGVLAVTMHSSQQGLTAIRAVITSNGTTVAVLTDTELDTSSRGQGAQVLYRFSQEWQAVPGTYTVDASSFVGSSVTATASAEFTVLGPVATPEATPSPDPVPSTTSGPSAEPSPSSSPSMTAGPTAAPEPTTSPAPTPHSTPPHSTPQPSHTADPVTTPEPVVPSAGSATRTPVAGTYEWTNTFTITGIKPNTAHVFIEINLHNEISAPYYAGAKSYPCGSLTLVSGSGANALYSCSVTVTVEPPASWRDGEFWRPMPASVFAPKIIVAGKTYKGTGGNWTPGAKGA